MMDLPNWNYRLLNTILLEIVGKIVKIFFSLPTRLDSDFSYANVISKGIES